MASAEGPRALHSKNARFMTTSSGGGDAWRKSALHHGLSASTRPADQQSQLLSFRFKEIILGGCPWFLAS